ncbi:hypothetical protein RN001_002333 [Aquatica leii]|uniref:MADF domain-containing protein n=1 Tax=Aquatica leii TaxID=1421715 RepID=A0AAN7PGW5_9COLE|nr:hypothetical protein RN001_002333 [Aquatica leii]
MTKKEKQFLTEFIELYRSFPCLWKIKSKEYSDRNVKSQAYEIMIEKMQEFDPEADRETVVKKINTLRTAYRRELKKKVDSERSGVGGDEVYVPHLWYFDILNFIRDQEISRKTQTNVEDENESEQIAAELEVTREPGPFSPGDELGELQSVSTPPTPLSSTSRASISTSRTSTQTTRTAKRQIDKCDEILDAIGKRFATPAVVDDKFTLIAKTWAMKLRDLIPNQAIYAEKLINDVFYAAQLENLTASCTFQIPSSQPAHRSQNHTYSQHTQPYQQNVQYYNEQYSHQVQPWPSSLPLRPIYSQLQSQPSVQQAQQLPEETDSDAQLHLPHQRNQYQQEHQRFLEQEPVRKESNEHMGGSSVANYLKDFQDI